jgi:hypothetical protein
MSDNSNNKDIIINMNDMSEFFQWFFITSISNNSDPEKNTEFINKIVENSIVNDKNEYDGTHKISMTVNDIKVDPLFAINELQKQYERIVNERVEKRLNEILTEEHLKEAFEQFKLNLLSKLNK